MSVKVPNILFLSSGSCLPIAITIAHVIINDSKFYFDIFIVGCFLGCTKLLYLFSNIKFYDFLFNSLSRKDIVIFLISEVSPRVYA